MRSCHSREIEDAWFGARIGEQNVMWTRTEQQAHFRLRIVQVAEVHAVGRADRNTGRVQALLDAMDAKRAFVRISIRVYKTRIVGTSSQARFAADAFVVRYQHHAASFMH